MKLKKHSKILIGIVVAVLLLTGITAGYLQSYYHTDTQAVSAYQYKQNSDIGMLVLAPAWVFSLDIRQAFRILFRQYWVMMVIQCFQTAALCVNPKIRRQDLFFIRAVK